MNRPLAAVALCVLASALPARAQDRRVDFRFAPSFHLTALCFPGDWQKTVVTEQGTLAYDFGPGPYVRPLTEVWLGARGATLAINRLAIDDPRVPIAHAEFSGDGFSLRTEAFAVPPEPLSPPSNVFAGGTIRRLGGLTGAAGWATPPAGTDPAFRNAAWGTNRPILYRVRVAPGSSKRVALGICEPYKSVTGQRVMELRVEGAPIRTVEALKDTQKNRPYVYLFDGRDANNDGELAIEVHGSTRGLDPNVILNAFWVFPAGTAITEEEIIRGHGQERAERSWSCGTEYALGAATPRIDGILGSYAGTQVLPTLHVRSGRFFTFDSAAGSLTGGLLSIVARPGPVAVVHEGSTWTLEFPRGTTEVQVLVSNGPRRDGALPGDLHEAMQLAVTFWKTQTSLPYGHITVPDAGLQYLLDASIRNLYQIGEWVDGGFQFQPGPSVYRGLWLHDQAWQTSAVLMLGDTAAARRIIDTALRHQRADGRVELIEPFPMQRETPLVVYAMSRYAAMTGDARWLREHWWNVTRGVSWIRRANRSTLTDPASRYFGLFPPGFTDGGLGGLEAEYGTTYWGMIALRAAARSAASLGERDSARSWDRLASGIMSAFRTASARDARVDAHGNRYLPMLVGDTSSSFLPQQANWGMLDGQGIGHLFPYDDPLVTGTLAMLDAVSIEGIPRSVGWLKSGVWPFLGAMHGIAHAYQRNYGRARDILYAYANHASPLGTWVEEQLPKGEGTRTTGDASNATASSLYIKLLRRLLVMERGDTLALLEGLPAEWVRPGALLSLKGVGTEFGPLTLGLTISQDGRRAEIDVAPLPRGRECLLRLDLSALHDAGYVLPDGRELLPVHVAPGTASIRLSLVKSR
jgi:hypothetical protein